MKFLSLPFLLALATQAQPQPLSVGGNYATPFESWLTKQAEKYWDQRDHAVAELSNATGIRTRQEYVRTTMIGLIGGLPKDRTPLRPQVTGRFARDGYRVENIIFESQPGFRVTANLYIPTTGTPPFPAVLGVAGHSVNGKASATYQAAFIGFVRQGFAVLAFDPPGQGERSEYFDADSGKSRIGIGTAEHTMAGLQCLLTGQTLARYEIWDGVRAFDYLLTRPEIDPTRIAVAGNSGGGTQAAYLAVVEPRLAAAVSSCYITRWRELWSGPGPQDAEQVFPSFLAKGLDFGDFGLALAPRPFLMTTAIQDFFPIAGARATYKQNQRLFDLLAAGDRAGYFEFDDTHGWSKPRREAAYRFLNRWIRGQESDGREQPENPEEESVLYATATGQLATSGGSETVQSLNLVRARELAQTRAPLTTATLASAIGWTGQPATPAANTIGELVRDGVRVETLELTVEGGVAIPALLFHPSANPGGRVTLFVSSSGKADIDLIALAKAGTAVLAIDPRGTGESYKPSGRSGYREPYQLAARAMLVGRNLVEIQVSDILAAARYLGSRPESAGRKLTLFAKGAMGPAAMVAAALDRRITELVVEKSIISYMDVASARIHEGLDQTIIPGILEKADLPDALRLMAGRPVTLVSPVHPNGRAMTTPEARRSLGAAANSAQIVLRGEGWPLGRALPRWLPETASRP